MKKRFFIILTALTAFLLSSCMANENINEKYESSASQAAEAGYVAESEAMVEAEEPIPDPIADVNPATSIKMVYSASVSIETKNFGADYDSILNVCAESGGYLESEDTDSLSEENGRVNARSSRFVFRVPAGNLNSFLDALSQIGEMTEKNRSAEDMSENYTDLEARIEVLEARRQRLMDHLNSASDMEDIILLEDQLADTISELEDLQGSKRSMDNSVDYAAVSVSLNEVILPETIGRDGMPLGDRAANAFSQSMAGMGIFLENFAVFWAAAAPVLILIAVILVAVFVIIKLALWLRKKSLNKRTRQNRDGEYCSNPGANNNYNENNLR